MIAINALMTMALLPISMHRHPCCCQAGVVALITIALLPLIRNGIVALFAMALSPSSSWCCPPCCNGIAITIDLVPLIACCQAGVAALVVMALSLLMCRRLHCCNGNCCSCQDGIVAIVDAHASPPFVKLALSPLS